MKLRTLLVTGALALSALAGVAQADNHPARALSIRHAPACRQSHLDDRTPQPACKVVTADMKFIDTAGKPEDITYSKMSDSCNFNN